jgi:putative DNA primase/helicase
MSGQPELPKLLPFPDRDHIPAELLPWRRFCAGKPVWDESKSKYKKPPYSPVTGEGVGPIPRYAEHFLPFDKAEAGTRRHGLPLMGMVFFKEDGLVCIDIDDAYNQEGVLDPDVKMWLRWFPSAWIHKSPSRTGLHLIGRGKISKNLSAVPLSKTSPATIEMLAWDHYATLTGELLSSEGEPLPPGVLPSLVDIQVGVSKLWEYVVKDGTPASGPEAEGDGETRPMSRFTARKIHEDNKQALREAKIGEHNGNALLNTAAFFMSRAFAAGVFEETEEQLKKELFDIVTKEWTHKHPEDQARATINSGWDSGKNSPLVIASLGRTDAANAERFVTRHADKARYCGSDKMWYVWDGRRWAPSLRGEHVRLALETVRSIYIEVSKITDEEERNDLIAWAKKSEMAPQILNMLRLAANFKELAIISSDLDADPWLLTVENGTIELKTGTVRPHRREDLISKMVHTEFKPRASCPVWEEHLELVLPQGDTRTFFQRAAGYSLTGLDVEEVFFFLQGGGQNGKSKTLEILAALLGDYAWTSTFGAFMRSHNGVPLNVIADMMGRRFVVVDEGEESQSFNESLLKNMTGGGTVSGRQLYSRAINYRPTFKLWFGSNYKPNIQGMDLAIWRRVRLVPFNVTIPEERRDKFFSEKLKSELPGILNWALAGLAEWQKSGLGVSEEVRSATRAYRSEMDTVKEFVDECCERRVAGDFKLATLYSAFHEWSKQNGNQWPLKKRPFMDRLRKMGFVIPEGGTHARRVQGLALVSIT